MKSIVVVPDTNVFLHCKPLEDLPWNTLGADEVRIVLVDPVIAELDRWKDRGDDRRAKRVRALLPKIRQLVDQENGVVIAAGPPMVVLALSKVDLNQVAIGSEDADGQILFAADSLGRSLGQPTLVLTRDVLMALRARRRSLDVRLIAPEEVQWNANIERADPQIKELQQELGYLKRQLPEISAALTTSSGTIEGDRVIVFQPKITAFDERGHVITDWATRYFAEHPPQSSTGRSWDLHDSEWRRSLRGLDEDAILELARRTAGGIGVLTIRNTGSVNAEDVRAEFIAENGWLLAARVPHLHFEVPKPPIARERNPLEIRIPTPNSFAFKPPGPIDLSEPVWDVKETETAGTNRLVARIPLLRHRDEVRVEFRVGHPESERPGKVIVRITVARNPKPTTIIYRLERDVRNAKFSELCAAFIERGEFNVHVKKR